MWKHTREDILKDPSHSRQTYGENVDFSVTRGGRGGRRGRGGFGRGRGRGGRSYAPPDVAVDWGMLVIGLEAFS